MTSSWAAGTISTQLFAHDEAAKKTTIGASIPSWPARCSRASRRRSGTATPSGPRVLPCRERGLSPAAAPPTTRSALPRVRRAPPSAAQTRVPSPPGAPMPLATPRPSWPKLQRNGSSHELPPEAPPLPKPPAAAPRCPACSPGSAPPGADWPEPPLPRSSR